ncbi:MAG: bifunctional UDP-N-acetylglucosamine diphosphorylase/glucosamine-1-phosphate N-acetyltransferase GlmU, partial [Myxococcales bacterium]|nr:bifunctional UDP-N-acetylglucosamine diphosphorylase/glucosamine-1-phosphate N-acetyltransferase GlmU [Myxococcales bacterium]
MRSSVPKVLHSAAGRPLIDHVLDSARSLSPVSIVVIVGHKTKTVRQHFAGRSDVQLAVQEPQLGTGHALLQAEPFLKGKGGSVLLLSGDVPLLRASTVQALVSHHVNRKAAATVLTATIERPDGYGRILRKDGSISAIVEHKDASTEERDIREINSGVYVFDLGRLFDALRQIGAGNAQGEYYLPDLVRIYRTQGLPVETVSLSDPTEILGVNSRKELADVAAIFRERKNDELMASGVTIVDPATTWVEQDVIIGPDTVLHPGVYLEGQSRIGSGCEIHSGVRIVDSTLGDRVVVNNFCVIRQSSLESGAIVGPFAQLRPASRVKENAHVGSFVELKNTTLGRGSKANHLAYLGDATIGDKVNVGAGTITCN